MTNKQIIEEFAKNQEPFKQGAITLAKEAKANGYKLTVEGLKTFLNNCEDGIGTEARNFYELCIPFAIVNN
jgi:hypothetical protein